MFLTVKVVMYIKFTYIIETLKDTENVLEKLGKDFLTYRFNSAAIVSNILWVHQKIIHQFKNV